MLNLIGASLAFLFVAYQSQAASFTDDGFYMFDSLKGEVLCMSGADNEDGQLIHQKVDINYARALFNETSQRKTTKTYNGFTMNNHGQLVQKNFYHCQVFKPAIQAQTKFVKAVRRQKLQEKQIQKAIGQKETKNLKHQIGLWNNQPDSRQALTKKEEKKYSATGRIVYKNITYGSTFAKHNHGMSTAFALACPNGDKDIVITTAHTFRTSENKPYSRYSKNSRHANKTRYLPNSDLSFQHRYGTKHLKKAKIVSGWVVANDGWKAKNQNDWAIVTELPYSFHPTTVTPYRLGQTSNIKKGRCIRMISWFQKSFSKEPRKYIQTCKITKVVQKKGQKMLRHNCQTRDGSSGAALLYCADSTVLGLHKGYSSTDDRVVKHFDTNDSYNIAIAMEGDFKKAILKQCKK
ncbi:hypothetical protein SPONN_2775 [uncultured Candidatus Thioglobus sp.]|nr:hypothetical protein SPONN_2775 [uncultured Candidatus Thioglobus sp.]